MNELVCWNPAHIFVLGDLVVSTSLEPPTDGARIQLCKPETRVPRVANG